MTASKPASATMFAISRASVATTRRSQMPRSAMRRVTTTMRGSPASGRSGLRGSRVESSPRLLRDAGSSYDPQEVLENALPVLRPDRLGMELHPIRRMITMLHGHDFRWVGRALAVGAHGGHHQIGR